MWNQRHSELDMPALPLTPGEYSVDIYLDSALVTTYKFTVTN
jgi:hypothetical protein